MLLVGKFKPFPDFETFDEDELPTNSDVMIVLSQYLNALESWRSAHIKKKPGSYNDWIWDVEGKTGIDADRPTRFSEKESQNG